MWSFTTRNRPSRCHRHRHHHFMVLIINLIKTETVQGTHNNHIELVVFTQNCEVGSCCFFFVLVIMIPLSSGRSFFSDNVSENKCFAHTKKSNLICHTAWVKNELGKAASMLMLKLVINFVFSKGTYFSPVNSCFRFSLANFGMSHKLEGEKLSKKRTSIFLVVCRVHYPSCCCASSHPKWINYKLLKFLAWLGKSPPPRSTKPQQQALVSLNLTVGTFFIIGRFYCISLSLR